MTAGLTALLVDNAGQAHRTWLRWNAQVQRPIHMHTQPMPVGACMVGGYMAGQHLYASNVAKEGNRITISESIFDSSEVC